MPEIKNIHLPESYKDIDAIKNDYLKKKYVFISLYGFKTQIEAKKVKDFLLGMTYAKNGIAFQYKKMMLFSMITGHDKKDCIKLSKFAWRNKRRKRVSLRSFI